MLSQITGKSVTLILNCVDKQAGVTGGSLPEPSKVTRDIGLSPGEPLQSNASTANLGVIGRRSVSDLGAIGNNINASTGSSEGTHDQLYNLQMLEAAYHRLPQPKDSERAKPYIPVCSVTCGWLCFST